MIYTELTPNPGSIKFVIDDSLPSFPTQNFPDVASASAVPLVTDLFALGFVTGVMFGKDHFQRNFITVTKSEDTKWEDLIIPIKKLLQSYIDAGKSLIEGIETHEPQATKSSDEVVQKILDIINNEIRPAVAMDGGDITFESFEDGVVKLHLKGSCSGCPSSLITLKQGIQALLTRVIPEVIAVEAV